MLQLLRPLVWLRLAVHAQSKSVVQDGLHQWFAWLEWLVRLAQRLWCRYSSCLEFPRQCCPGVARLRVRDGHGRSGHASGAHGVRRCFQTRHHLLEARSHLALRWRSLLTLGHWHRWKRCLPGGVHHHARHVHDGLHHRAHHVHGDLRHGVHVHCALRRHRRSAQAAHRCGLRFGFHFGYRCDHHDGLRGAHARQQAALRVHHAQNVRRVRDGLRLRAIHCDPLIGLHCVHRGLRHGDRLRGVRGSRLRCLRCVRHGGHRDHHGGHRDHLHGVRHRDHLRGFHCGVHRCGLRVPCRLFCPRWLALLQWRCHRTGFSASRRNRLWLLERPRVLLQPYGQVWLRPPGLLA